MAENTINGTGLISNTTIGEDHAVYAYGNHWTTAGGTNPLDASITWGFNVGVSLGGIYIWNHQSSPGHANNSGYEPTLFDLEIFDTGGTSLAFFNDVVLAPDSASAQPFSFTQVFNNVGSVRFDVEAVQSSPNYTGLAEVAFDDALIAGVPTIGTVPLPGSLPLLAGGLVLTGVILRRRTGDSA